MHKFINTTVMRPSSETCQLQSEGKRKWTARAGSALGGAYRTCVKALKTTAHWPRCEKLVLFVFLPTYRS